MSHEAIVEVSESFWHESADVLPNEVGFREVEDSVDFVVDVGDETHVVEIPAAGQDAGVGVLAVF